MNKMITVLILVLLITGQLMGQTTGDPNRIQGWVLVYEHDANGASVSGSLEKLAKAINAGADVKVGFSTATHYIVSTCERLWVHMASNHCNCMDLDYVGVSIVDGIVDFEFVSDQYYGFYTFNTKGQMKLTRWSVGQHVDKGDNSWTYSMKWYVRIH